MSDTFQTPGSDEDSAPFDPVSFIQRQRMRQVGAALTSLDENPADAGRALELSDATGAPPALVHGDLENFEKDQKAKATAELLKNQYLAQYADSHPLAAKVSANDWGNLHEISEFAKPFIATKLGRAVSMAGPVSVAEKAVEGFTAGYGQDEIEPAVHRIFGNNSISNAVLALVQTNPAYYAPRIMQGLMYAGAAAGGQIATNVTGSEDWGNRLTRDLLIAPQVMLPEFAGFAVPHELQALAQAAATKGKPHIAAGVFPPPGIDPAFDKVHIEQAKDDSKALDKLLQSVQGSETKEIAPDLFAKNFLHDSVGLDGRIGVSAEAIRKLYGTEEGKPVEFDAEDNKLGWAPSIREQFDLAERHGGDVEIPMADWLAKVDPEVAKELHDNIRVRPNGMTLEEAKEPATAAAEPIKEEPQFKEVTDEARREPVGPIPPGPIEGRQDLPVIGRNERLFEFKVDGKEGMIRVEPHDDGRHLHISWIGSKGQDALSLGPSTLLKFLDAAKQEFPNLQTIGGTRISGARAAIGGKEVVRSIEQFRSEAADAMPVEALRQSAGLTAEGPVDLGKLQAELKGIVPSETRTGIVESTGTEAKTFPASAALKEVDNDRLTGLPRVLREVFEDRLNKAVGDIPVWVVDKDTIAALNKDLGHTEGTPAFYHGILHVIVMADDIASGSYGHSTAAHMLYHEMWHAFTFRALEANKELKATVRQMMDETLLHHGGDVVGKEFDYAFKNEHEFLAEAGSHSKFENALAETPISNELAGKLGLNAKGSTMWDAVRQVIRNLIELLTGKKAEPNMLDAFLSLGKRFEEANKQIKEGKGTAGAEPVDMETRILNFMPKGMREQYLEKMEKKFAEDLEFQKAQAEKRATETQTKEWKENEKEMRSTVRESLSNRPDIALDRFLREKEIDPSKLSSEEADILGRKYGYTTGDQMLGALQRLGQERELEGLTPAAHLSKLVNVETERRMRKEYGTLDEQIMKEAEDHVVSQTQIDLLHDQMLALGMGAKINEPLASVANMRVAVREMLEDTLADSHSKAKYLAAAGRAGNRVQAELLEDNIVGAFKAKQEQTYSMILADEAGKLEKQAVRDDKLIKKLSQRAPTGVEPEFANFAQEILHRIGKGGRIWEDLMRQRDLISEHKDLASFVSSVNDKGGIWNHDPDAMPVGQQMPVAGFILDPDFRKKLEDMTVAERKAVMDALRTIDKNGRDARKYNVKGDKEDLDKVLDGLIERLKAAVDNKKLSQSPTPKTNWWRMAGSMFLNPETWFNRLDLGNRRGPFNQLVMRPIIEGQYDLKTLERQYAKEYREIGDFPDTRKKIDNPLFRDTDGTLLDLNQGHLWSIIANMGNKEQRRKLAGGYGIDNPDKIFQWLFSVTKKEDWDRAQKMGEMFSRIFERSEKMYGELTGVVPERIQLGTIQTPWGEMKEWYHPLIPNPLKRNPELTAKQMMEESGYFKPSPAAGYTKKRTGAVYPIDLSFDSIPGKIKMMLNDIAMRPAITEVGKVLLNKKFRDAFNSYYGKEYGSALTPWLRDAAGQRRFEPAQDAALGSFVNSLRENMSTLLIGWNIGTVMKHAPTALAFSMREVGPLRFMDSLSHILGETDQGKSRWRFAMDSSEELQNRLRSTRESISATNQDLFKKYSWDHKVFSVRDAIQTLGATPVAMSDFMSAVPMWDAAYRKAREEDPNMSHGDAVYLANTAVRRTHGSSIITNRPSIMRQNAWVQNFMPFYNFFNNALQRLNESSWQAKLALTGRSLPEMTGFEKEEFKRGGAAMKLALGGFLTYGVIVSMVEQAVDPLPAYDPHDKYGPAKYWAKVIARGPTAMIPGLRNIIDPIFAGHAPSAGLLDTLYQDVAKPFIEKDPLHDPARFLRTTNDAVGAMTGLTYGTVGKVGEYIYNLENRKERPRGAWETAVGMRYGTTKDHAKTFDEYRKHLVGKK